MEEFAWPPTSNESLPTDSSRTALLVGSMLGYAKLPLIVTIPHPIPNGNANFFCYRAPPLLSMFEPQPTHASQAPATANLRSPRLRSAPLADIAPRRICLIKPSALGDIVQTLPVLSMLRRRFPQSHIAWVVKPGLADILRGHPELDQVIELPAGKGWRQVPAFAALLRQLRRERFDLAIDMQGLFRSGLLTWATRAPRRLGYRHAREGAARAYTDTVDARYWEMPAIDHYQLFARQLGCQGEVPRAVLPITSEQHRDIAQQLAHLPRPLLAIHAGAQWETKRWPPESFAWLARQAWNQYGAGVVLLGGPGEKRLADQVAEQISGPLVNLAEATRLPELAAAAAAADVFLAGDTGPMHLAAAVGTRVVSVFTCTSPLRAGPRGDAHLVVATQVDCAASYLKKCPLMKCMLELTPQRVWPALAKQLEAESRRLAS